MADRAPPRGTDTDGLRLGDLAPGSRIGEYLIQHTASSRGTGHVYVGAHLVLPRHVTIKVMPATEAWNRSLALQLLREACIVDALDHPGIPRVYECGMLADRRPWIATELVDGATLETVLIRSSVSALDAAAIVRDVAEILDYAHGRGLVHRHVSPRAIVIPDVPRRFPLCLVDWSGARTHDSEHPRPIVGDVSAIPYGAPDDEVASPSDIYSLGMVARELLQRACPGTAPPVFAALVHRMLDRNPARRPIANEVRDHAAWLANEIEPEPAIPESIDDDRTIPMPGVPRAITSELTPQVSGELHLPRR